MATNNATNTPQLTTNGQIIVGSTGVVPVATTITAGSNITVTNGAGSITIAASGSGNNLVLAVSQAAHGFAVGDVLYLSSGTYVKANANTAATAEVVGIVSVVAGANDFTLLMYGQITTLSGLTAGTVYFLSGSAAGAYTATQVTTVGYVDKPLMVALSTTAAFFYNERGKVLPASAIVNQASSSVTMVAGTTYVINNGASLVTLTVPVATAIGDVFNVIGQSSGKWLVQMNGGQTCNTGAASTTAAGSVAAGTRYDCLQMVCTVANTSFVLSNGYGTFTTA